MPERAHGNGRFRDIHAIRGRRLQLLLDGCQDDEHGGPQSNYGSVWRTRRQACVLQYGSSVLDAYREGARQHSSPWNRRCLLCERSDVLRASRLDAGDKKGLVG